MTTSSNTRIRVDRRIRVTSALTISALAILLTACGGGGGGSTVPVQTPVVTTPTPVFVGSSIVVTAAPTPTYAQNSEELAAFNLLNAERSACGFGTLIQSTQIDQAASAHAAWQVSNFVVGHYEDKAVYPNGFTGYDSDARIGYQGYTNLGGSGESFSVSGGNSKVGTGISWTRNLLSAPFHLRTMMDGYRDAGISSKNNIDTGTRNKEVILQFNFAYKGSAEKQQPDSNTVLTYPCQDTTGTAYQLLNETPNPVPGRNLAVLPLGQPVLIKVRDGNTLAITTATMTNTITSASVLLRSAAQTRADDTEWLFSSSEAYVIPDAPLSPNTNYTVAITGTNSGKAFSRNFTFSTGP